MGDATFPGSGWEGFIATRFVPISDFECLIHLVPDPQVPPRCPGCRRSCSLIHDTTTRRVRDRDLFEYRVWLEVPVRRVRCPRCGVGREALSWLAPRARLTHRLRQHVEVLLTLLPLKQIAGLTGLHWHTLKTIDKARLARDLPEPDLAQVRYLVMDEFALFKGHRYASVVIDAETRQVLWVGEGRSREAVRPCFEWLGPHCEHIEAVAMDMNTAMDLEVQAWCPKARVVYDLFHVIAKFGREVIDRARSPTSFASWPSCSSWKMRPWNATRLINGRWSRQLSPHGMRRLTNASSTPWKAGASAPIRRSFSGAWKSTGCCRGSNPTSFLMTSVATCNLAPERSPWSTFRSESRTGR